MNSLSYKKKSHIINCALLLALAATSRRAEAVPQLFLQERAGQQADVTWGRLENDRFIIYYDSSQPTLAEHALNAVEKAFPDYSLLLGTTLADQPLPKGLTLENTIVSRFNKIPVIVSSRTDGPSFANFIPQTLEIQSSVRPPSALFQHELAHRMMYEHIDLKVGPAGRTFMLAMLPTWWTEGLPEYLTESLGRLQTEGYLRAMVLNDSFLSWDRMHALYKASGSNALLGYATSGRFFKYFLERTPEKSLTALHKNLKTYQLIPPFFSGAYMLLKNKTGQWPGDLYESFKKDISAEIRKDLQGMPRLQEISGAHQIFNIFGRGSFLIQDNHLVTPDFSTPKRAGGMAVYTFRNDDLKKLKASYIQPLDLKSQDRVFAHRKELVGGGFWSTTQQLDKNRTAGHLLSYHSFNGAIFNLENESLNGKKDFPLDEDGTSPDILDIVSTAPQVAAVLTSKNTSTSVFMVDAQSGQKKFMGKWLAPDSVSLVRTHDAYDKSESKTCISVIVDQDHERTSLQRICKGEAAQVVIPAGQYVIRDALQTGPEDYLLLVGWHNTQALIQWTAGRTEFVSGFPDWIESIKPGQKPDSLMLSVFNGRSLELWATSVNALRASHLAWIARQPETSKWWTPPGYKPYSPPFVRYAAALRDGIPAEQKNEPVSAIPETRSTTVPAPYRFKHWMTYPNFTPSFLAGVTSIGLFSRPMVDEMERFYVQLFGSYVFDDSLQNSDRWGLEANLVGNRVFDGWKANVFLRPRFNGIAYSYYCRRSKTDPVSTCPQNRPTELTQFYTYTYLREMGTDFRLNKSHPSASAATSWSAKVFKISPSSSNSFIADAPLGAQNTILGSVGTSLDKSLWGHVFFTGPVSEIDKEEIVAGGSLRLGVDTTHSLNKAKSGEGLDLKKVGFQNYSIELAHNASYFGHSLGLRTNYSSTGGGTPLNLQEFFRPFKTYLIGANDGLQDISTSLSGNGLLGYNLVGRAQYRNSLNYTFPLLSSINTRFGPAFLERLEGEVVLSRGGVSDNYDLRKTESITTLTGSMRLNIDVKGYGFYPAILYGKAIDKPLWQLFTQIRFDQFW